MKKDDDIVKAVGWVTIQASHLENKIKEMAIFISPGFNRPKNHERRFVSQKIKWIEEKIEELNDPTLNPLSVDLKKASCLLEERNKIVHGRIYFDPILPERLVPSRENLKEKEITPDEIYDLAERILNLHTRILSNNAYTLQDSLIKLIEA